MPGGALVESIRRDTTRSLLRARNGIRYVAGIGRPNLGVTPKDVVWSRGETQLWRYRSDRRTGPPMVIVFSILGRSYVLDLRPGSSFVEALLAAGRDVFLVDWGEPRGADSQNTLETYVDRHLPRALRAAHEEAGSDTIDVVGYCFGGVLALLTVAGHPRLDVRRFVLMATPVDFTPIGGLVDAFRRGRLEVDDVLDDTGNVPPEAIYRMFRTLKPTSDIANYAALWEGLWSDEFVEGYQAMAQWVRDQVPFPGACARQSVDVLLRQNALAGGEVPLGGRSIRLADVTCPLLNVMATRDHIVPPESAEPVADLVGSADVTELRVPSGHVGLATGRHAYRTTIPGIVEWLRT